MAAQADTNREKLQNLLRELFQFDASDLDFGVYRILNQRRGEIERFIEDDLLDAVDDALEHLQKKDVTDLELEVEEKREIVEENLGEGVFTDDGGIEEEHRELKAAREYLDARKHLEQARTRAQVGEETEARIFNDLYRFFSRYYENGDFHTKRRFSSRDSKFYVPYDGEETLFYWANRDQYYIKTSEHFSEYRFEVGDLTVEFQLEEANVPQDNVKGDERYFVLSDGEPVTYRADQDIVTVKFQYRQITEEEAASIVETYNDATGDDRKSLAYKTNTILCTALETQILAELENATVEKSLGEPDGEATRSPLGSHLTRYTAEHTMDYFIHKDLEGFLRRELDFFLKNEILDVDELLTDGDRRTPAPVTLRAQVIRDIAERIITFLAQIEDFQKRLFEKKKFVVQTDYMVTLDHVPDELYEEVLENEEQLEQWKDVYNIHEWENSLFWNGSFDHSFLENHPHLMVDTALFDEEFKAQLLETFDDMESATDGVLIHGENFQGLNLLSEKYRNQVSSIYIDPPYNTGNDEFLYKDRFRHSSWLSMVADRVSLSKTLLDEEGLFFSSIDENEIQNYLHALSKTFNERVSVVVVRNNPKGRSLDRYLSTSHEYLLTFAQKQVEIEGLPKTESQLEEYSYEDSRGRYRTHPLRNTHRQFNRETRPNLWYPFYVDPETGDISLEDGDDRVAVLPIWNDGLEGCWTWGREKAEENLGDLEARKVSGEWRIYRKDYADGATYTPKTIWDDTELRTDFAQQELDALFGERIFRSPKPPGLIERTAQLAPSGSRFVCDFFAGSGTTAEAVIRLNEARSTDLAYLLIEFGDHFDEVLRPRIQKLCFSLDWEGGLPQDREGRSHLVRYSRIESYDDTLSNIHLQSPGDPQQTVLTDEIDEYVEGYMLEFESSESPSLLRKEAFESPFSFKLQIEQNGASPQPTTVDLVETFHYLVGAHVRRYRREEHQGRRYVLTECDVRTDTGTDRILTIWRDTEDLDLEKEAEWIEDAFEPQTYDRLYINTESYVNEAKPIEVTFRERMEAPPRVS